MLSLVSRRPFKVLAITLAAVIAVTSIVVAVVIYTTDSSEQATIAGAFLALLGVLITQGVNTMIAWTTARDNQERSLALEEQRFQADTFKQYFEYVSRLIADDLELAPIGEYRMCQRAVRRLCNPCERCLVRKVARLLAQPLTGFGSTDG